MAQKQRQNYFDQNIRNFGEDFILTLKPDKIQRDAKTRIFREMVQGAIDYTEYGKYFTDPKFCENLIIAAWDELNNNALLKQGMMEFDLHHPGDSRVVVLVAKHTSLEYVYSYLYNTLQTMKMNGYDISFLIGIAPALYQYRNQI